MKPAVPRKFPNLAAGQTHTLETIHARCIEEGDCWLWQAGKSNGSPAIRHGKKTVAVRLYIATVLQGKNTTGRLVTMCCDSIDCVAPAHIVTWRRKQLQRFTAKRTGYARKPEYRARQAAARQKNSALDWDKVRAIRASTGSTRDIARQFGERQSTIQSIRAGDSWRETSPWAGLLLPTRKSNGPEI